MFKRHYYYFCCTAYLNIHPLPERPRLSTLPKTAQSVLIVLREKLLVHLCKSSSHAVGEISTLQISTVMLVAYSSMLAYY